jgi:hypothetical protein
MEKMFFIPSKPDFDKFFKPRKPATPKAPKSTSTPKASKATSSPKASKSTSTPKASKVSKASAKKNVGSEIKYNIMSGEMLKNFFGKKP